MNPNTRSSKAVMITLLASATLMLSACGKKPETETETNLPSSGMNSNYPGISTPSALDGTSPAGTGLTPPPGDGSGSSSSGSSMSNSSMPTTGSIPPTSPSSLIEGAPQKKFEATRIV